MTPPLSKTNPTAPTQYCETSPSSLSEIPPKAAQSINSDFPITRWYELVSGGGNQVHDRPRAAAIPLLGLPLMTLALVQSLLPILEENFPNLWAQVQAESPHGRDSSHREGTALPLLQGIRQLLHLIRSPDPEFEQKVSQIRTWFAEKPEYRTGIPHSQWDSLPESSHHMRPPAICLLELGAMGVPFREIPFDREKVIAPVEVTGPIDGVEFVKRGAGGRLYLACEMAARLPYLARSFRDHGIRRVEVISALRKDPPASFHTLGLGLDMTKFWIGERRLTVYRDYVPDFDQLTCPGASDLGGWGRLLRDLACEWSGSRLFNTVLTPNYTRGHEDHFHLDMRPEDSIFFTR